MGHPRPSLASRCLRWKHTHAHCVPCRCILLIMRAMTQPTSSAGCAPSTKGHHTWGLEMNTGTLADMNELGICEAFKVKSQVLLSSSEAAEMILRVDDIVQCAPRQRDGQ